MFFSVSAFLACEKKSGSNNLSSTFNITKENILMSANNMETLPNKYKLLIESNIDRFAQLLDETLTEMKSDNNNYILFPVDKKRHIPGQFTPPDLISLDAEGFVVNKKGMKVRKAILPQIKKMINDAKNENLNIMISSAFRTYKYQEGLFNRYIKNHGKEEAMRFSAPPGGSQHQLGTVIDLGSISLEFRDTPEGIWMKDNGYKYGFSLSFPEGYEEETGYMYEPWHFRYVSPSGALLEKEFFGGFQYLMLDYLYANSDTFMPKQSTTVLE